MGATSVTGIGHGSVEGKDMGRKEYTVAGNRLIGPRVVAADTTTLAAGAATVVLPMLPGAITNYIVVATDSTAANAVKAVLANGVEDTHITLAGTGTDVIQWAIIKQCIMP